MYAYFFYFNFQFDLEIFLIKHVRIHICISDLIGKSIAIKKFT